jgi:hypothetical protein
MKRSVLRWIHLIFAIPIIGYIYSPFADLPNYSPRGSIYRLSGHSPFGALDVCRGILRRHRRRGMARYMSDVWIWCGYPDFGRATHRAEDLVG